MGERKTGEAAAPEAIVDQLREGGFDVVNALDDDVVAIVVALDESVAALPACARSEHATFVPVIAVSDCGAESQLRLSIDGAVQCIPLGATAASVVRAVEAALAPDAPPVSEQRRRARIAALEAVARGESPAPGALDTHTRVHLTRLEHSGERGGRPAQVGASRFDQCSAKQRALLELIAREGSVGKAAAAIGTTRSSIYAALRKLAHQVGLRDSGDVLRLIGTHEPAGR